MNYIAAAHIAIASWVFVMLLTNEDEVFYWWRKLVYRFKSEYIRRPLVDCEYCVAGQISCWGYLYFEFYSYNPIYHIAFITTTIFMVELINLLCKTIRVLKD